MMNILFNDGNKDHLIEIFDDGFEEIKIEPTDYVNNKYVLDDGKIRIDGNAVYSIPFGNLSNTFKGKIGENVSCIRRNLERTDAEGLYYLTEPRCTYDITNYSGTAKIEVKTGFEKHYGKTGKATSFNFYLSTNRPGKNGVQISKSKYKKSYELDGINYVECIGIFNDSSIMPNIYILPTNSSEIRNSSKITLPSSERTKYNKYKKHISDSYKLDE